MKRVKIMLMSLTLLAIVGGALAFKAKYNVDFCTTTEYIAGQKTTCPLYTTLSKVTDDPVATFYTTIALNSDCTFRNGSGQVQQTICETWASITKD